MGRPLMHDEVEVRLGTRDPELGGVLERVRCGVVPDAPANLVLDSWALVLAEIVVRRFSRHSASVRDMVPGGLPMLRVARVVAFIEANIEQDLRLEALAAVAELSPFHFARRFKETVGVSPHAYVLAQRIGRARSMLRDTKVGLSELAVACGFSSQAHLTTAFRHRLGTTPQAYRIAMAF